VGYANMQSTSIIAKPVKGLGYVNITKRDDTVMIVERK
jgi:hypothetical protein